MTRSTGARAVRAALAAALVALSAACGAVGDGRTPPTAGGQPKHGADETWFTTSGVTPEDPAVLLRELRAGRAPKALGLVRSGAKAGASYAYVNWEWSLWPPGLRPVGVALTPVRARDTTVAVGPVRRHGQVPELSLRVRADSGAAWTATLREWQRAPHTFAGPSTAGGASRAGARRAGFTYQYVVEGEPTMEPLEGPAQLEGPVEHSVPRRP